MGYSEDFRKRVVVYLLEGHTQESAKKVFKVGISAMRRWQRQFNEHGHVKNKPLNRPYKKIDPEKLSAYVKERPDACLREMAEIFKCSGEAVRKILEKLNITRKKRRKSIEKETKKNAINS